MLVVVLGDEDAPVSGRSGASSARRATAASSTAGRCRWPWAHGSLGPHPASGAPCFERLICRRPTRVGDRARTCRSDTRCVLRTPYGHLAESPSFRGGPRLADRSARVAMGRRFARPAPGCPRAGRRSRYEGDVSMSARRSSFAVVVVAVLASTGCARRRRSPRSPPRGRPRQTSQRDSRHHVAAQTVPNTDTATSVHIDDKIRKACGISDDDAYFAYDSANLGAAAVLGLITRRRRARTARGDEGFASSGTPIRAGRRITIWPSACDARGRSGSSSRRRRIDKGEGRHVVTRRARRRGQTRVDGPRIAASTCSPH